MDLIERQAAIELIHSLYPSAPIMPMNRKRWEKKYKPYIEAEKALEMLPSVQPEVIACGSGELNDETGMMWVSNAGMLQTDEIHGSVLKTIPIFGEDTNDE